jgi:SSS family solute:Na+ symporter
MAPNPSAKAKMQAIDWTLVVVLNGAVVVYALLAPWLGRARKPVEKSSSQDWFLAGRSLAWWIVGLSAFATAIDSSDIVADSGGVYSLGIRYFVTNWVGTVIGWMLLAHVIALPMYRAGMYTNSEYLESRFGPAARVLSSLVQVQYRTMVMANISTTLFLTFAVVGNMGNAAWWVVGVIVFAATAYTVSGGSRSVALADAVQSAVMIAASVVLFIVVWRAVGGWDGIESKLEAQDATLPARMLQIGSDYVETTDVKDEPDESVWRTLLLGGEYDKQAKTITRRTPAWVVCLSFVLVGMAYSIVNHEQSMRLFAARSMWDMRMAVVVASLLLIGITFLNLMMGIMGRALFPATELLPVEESLRGTSDALYPVLVRDFTTVGFKGVVVAGLLAAAVSTYAGMSAAMSALLTRDVYARLIAPSRNDAHYVRVGRQLTWAVAGGSFLYIPFLLRKGMMSFYLELVGAFVVPLLTVYLMGVFTSVHRKSGTIGLLVGVAYGAWRLIAGFVAGEYGILILPSVMMDGFAAYPISLAVTAASSNNLPAALGLAVIGLGLWLSFVVFW